MPYSLAAGCDHYCLKERRCQWGSFDLTNSMQSRWYTRCAFKPCLQAEQPNMLGVLYSTPCDLAKGGAGKEKLYPTAPALYGQQTTRQATKQHPLCTLKTPT
jgi:hypothetical protein